MGPHADKAGADDLPEIGRDRACRGTPAQVSVAGAVALSVTALKKYGRL